MYPYGKIEIHKVDSKSGNWQSLYPHLPGIIYKFNLSISGSYLHALPHFVDLSLPLIKVISVVRGQKMMFGYI